MRNGGLPLPLSLPNREHCPLKTWTVKCQWCASGEEMCESSIDMFILQKHISTPRNFCRKPILPCCWLSFSAKKGAYLVDFGSETHPYGHSHTLNMLRTSSGSVNYTWIKHSNACRKLLLNQCIFSTSWSQKNLLFFKNGSPAYFCILYIKLHKIVVLKTLVRFLARQGSVFPINLYN